MGRCRVVILFVTLFDVLSLVTDSSLYLELFCTPGINNTSVLLCIVPKKQSCTIGVLFLLAPCFCFGTNEAFMGFGSPQCVCSSV